VGADILAYRSQCHEVTDFPNAIDYRPMLGAAIGRGQSKDENLPRTKSVAPPAKKKPMQAAITRTEDELPMTNSTKASNEPGK